MLNDLRKPFLAVDRLSRGDDGSVLLIRDKTRFRVRLGGPSAPIPDLWTNLQNADWSGWSEIRGAKTPVDELGVLVEALDRLALLEDAQPSDQLAFAEVEEVLALIAQTVQWLETEAKPRRVLVSILSAIRTFLRTKGADTDLSDLSRGALRRSSSRHIPESLAEVLIGHQLAYIRRNARLSFTALNTVCDQIVSPRRRRRDAELESLCGGLWEVRDVRIHLNTIAHLVRAMAQGDAQPLPATDTNERRRPMTGANFARAAERFARRVVSDFGTTRFQHALEKGDQIKRLGQGVFLHQYFITQRYVEAILPVLQLRLRPKLRHYVFRYFREELGHERHELEACRYLGIRKSAADNFIPLPYFAAYSEVLNTIAVRNPIGLMTSILVAEGLPGTVKPIVGLLQGHNVLPSPATDPSVSKHQALDVALDHPTMARRLLANVPMIPSETQAGALRDLSIMLSINRAGWNMLADYYLDPSLPVVPEFLDGRIRC